MFYCEIKRRIKTIPSDMIRISCKKLKCTHNVRTCLARIEKYTVVKKVKVRGGKRKSVRILNTEMPESQTCAFCKTGQYLFKLYKGETIITDKRPCSVCGKLTNVNEFKKYGPGYYIYSCAKCTRKQKQEDYLNATYVQNL